MPPSPTYKVRSPSGESGKLRSRLLQLGKPGTDPDPVDFANTDPDPQPSIFHIFSLRLGRYLGTYLPVEWGDPIFSPCPVARMS